MVCASTKLAAPWNVVTSTGLRRGLPVRRPGTSKVTAWRGASPKLVSGTPIQRLVYSENECNYCPTCQAGGKLLADRSLSRLLKSDWPRTLDELEQRRAASPFHND